MVSRFKRYITQNYFNQDFPLEHRVYMIFFFLAYIISIPSALTNTLLRKGAFGVSFQWLYILWCTIMLFVLPHTRLRIQKPHLLFVAFVYVPFLYFETAGYNGTALLFAPLAVFMLGILFSGRARVWAIGLNIMEYLICIYLSCLHPYLVTPHGSAEAQMIDLVVGLTMSFVGLAIMTAYISRIFKDNNIALAELAIRDDLTGVYNRRILSDLLQHELDVYRETGESIYIMMLDIDLFKQINDDYGHGVGDRVLISCTQAIQAALRGCDILVRYGGDEFVIVLIPPLPAAAEEIGQRIRRAIEGLRFDGGAAITASIGIEKSRPDDTTESLLRRADRRMYQAKQSGRNQVVAGWVMEGVA